MALIKGIIEEKFVEPPEASLKGEPFGPPGGPGGPGGPMGAKPVEYKAAVYIENGKYVQGKSTTSAVSGGKVDNMAASGIKISSDAENFNGVYVTGKCEYTLSDSSIGLYGKGTNDFAGIGAAVMADGGSTVTLRNMAITTNGVIRCATVVTGKSILKVYDSVLVANGGILPEGHVSKDGAGMDGPPVAFGLFGNCRAHLTMNNSRAYFYNSTIVADGWGTLSTDASMGYVYLEANNCLIKNTRSGYGSYSDGGCHNVFNNCTFESAAVSGIMGNECDMTFNDVKATCGTYLVMMHCYMGSPHVKGTLTINGGEIKTEKDSIFIKSDNADITIDGAKIVSRKGAIIRSVVNDDPHASKVNGAKVYGIRARLKHMFLEGDFLHEDTERTMSLSLVTTTLKGLIKNASVSFDTGSKWTATGDCKVTLVGDIDTAQIDAPEGVTITAIAGESGTYKLAGGGILNVIAQKQ